MPQESDDERDARTPDKKKLGKPMYGLFSVITSSLLEITLVLTICLFGFLIRYVYDLLQYLRTPDDPIKQEIGLASAEALIRQKEGVGTEIGKLQLLTA
jgi:hypothetical protein